MTTDYTSRAWTASNRDFFERNIISADDDWGSAEARAYNEFTANSPRGGWPTIDEASRWANSINSYPGIAGSANAVSVENLQWSLDAAIESMSMRTHIQVVPGDGLDTIEVPVSVKLGTLLRAIRWARRAMTPDGIAGASEIGGLIRTSAYDPDIESMIAPWLYIGLA